MSANDTKTRIYSGILGKIMKGEITPGSRLTEENMARSYGVSRTPVREVLFALERDGIIRRERDRGATVIAFGEDDIEEIFDIRAALECCALRKASHSYRLGELTALKDLIETANRMRGPAMHRIQEEADLRLHSMIVNACGNRRLIAYVANIALFRNAFLRIGYGEDDFALKVGKEHLAIISALICRDATESERLLVGHIRGGCQYAIETYRRKVGSRRRHLLRPEAISSK